jgi:undecaprenyldiphospho-muramoylpentapeptide beta-N-acetylglucosaminyltransferase
MIVAGGTGGHVYPALATAQAIRQIKPDAKLAFVGTISGFERPLVEQANIKFDANYEVQAGPLHGVNPLKMASSAFKLAQGIAQSWRIISKEKPQAILSTGGWASLPVALVAWVRRVPMLIYLPDIEPAMTINVLKRFAQKVAITVPESAQFFKDGQTVVTGYPLREEVMQATRQDAIAHFKLNPAKKTVLVFGGSRGAQAINIALGEALPQLLARDDVQVLHITGTYDWERMGEQTQALGIKDDPDYHAYPYLHDEMGLAFAVADVAICRAGASILGEFPFFRLPSILIPLAYQWHYQQVNADYLAQRGGAIHLDETDMNTQLLPTLEDLLDHPAQLDAMRVKIATLGQPNGAQNVANALLALAEEAR